MTVASRKIAGTDRDYLAYARKFSGRATYFVCFQDNLWGAVALHNFAEMLRLTWGQRPHLRIVEQDLSLKHPAVLELLRQSAVGSAPNIRPAGDDERSGNPCQSAPTSRQKRAHATTCTPDPQREHRHARL